jgi:multiple sugar transport system ATP-binding protein
MLQQVDTPQNLYDHPVNLFVAGFIGSPAMNLVTARLSTDGGQPTVSFGGHLLDVAASDVAARPGLSQYSGREVILGIRPSDFEAARLADAAWPRMPVSVGVTEELGSEIHVLFPIDAPPVMNKDTAALAADQGEDEATIPVPAGTSMWTARVSTRSRVRPGDNVELGVDTSNLHFFDPDTGLAIGREPSGDRE